MKMSESFIYTSKETPKDAELKSHQFLVRAGYIQQVGAGIYNLLPLGLSVLENIKTIIRKHLNDAGAQELVLGFVTPASFWQKSGRYEQYGKELLRIKDRKDQDFVLGPTYEEAIVECVRGRIASYKQLPINLYQIHLKFRDELRARFGLIRGREFVMKDAYSFHSTQEDLDREFLVMEEAYRKIFDELGIRYVVVEADSGAIGGSGSKEFMLLASCGEDTLVTCECGYASNIEVAKIGEDDKCCKCGSTLRYEKGIEIGHIFKLGDKYSKPMNATFLDQQGKAQPFVMGCYGIGVSRLIAGIAEQMSDDKGLCWNSNIAPFEKLILISNIKDERQREVGLSLYHHLRAKGERVLLDDRNERFGVKISDFELLGIPEALVVGKDLENGQVELINRKDSNRLRLEIDTILGA
ncbi:proline--tRNA ligase [Helicobacter enhydrae]|uniref:Proline--tRNA ligase n=1 Tax=Helicobacter enhydrae TaxID=222136 RepID=A0A1B1U3X0_9HELI|nr:proline--tRNA ligase [Helicobacter enhydrae]ANV97484.1 proline--tRNA ligase [Helicobacter enhydrae]